METVVLQKWSFEANIDESVIKSVQAMSYFQEFIPTGMQYYLHNENKKRLSHNTKEILYLDGNKPLVEWMINSDYDLAGLQYYVMYEYYNQFITQTELAGVLVGRKFLRGEKELDSSIDEWRRFRLTQLKSEAKLQMRQDATSGFKFDEAAKKESDDSGVSGESLVLGDLEFFGIPAHLILTEKQQLSENPEATSTPDILFKTPQNIGGIECNWIEVKNSVLVPEVSCDVTMDDLYEQIANYKDTFGPGIVIFTKGLFSDRLFNYLPEGVHVARFSNLNRHQKSKKALQKKQQEVATAVSHGKKKKKNSKKHAALEQNEQQEESSVGQG